MAHGQNWPCPNPGGSLITVMTGVWEVGCLHPVPVGGCAPAGNCVNPGGGCRDAVADCKDSVCTSGPTVSVMLCGLEGRREDSGSQKARGGMSRCSRNSDTHCSPPADTGKAGRLPSTEESAKCRLAMAQICQNEEWQCGRPGVDDPHCQKCPRRRGTAIADVACNRSWASAWLSISGRGCGRSCSPRPGFCYEQYEARLWVGVRWDCPPDLHYHQRTDQALTCRRSPLSSLASFISD